MDFLLLSDLSFFKRILASNKLNTVRQKVNLPEEIGIACSLLHILSEYNFDWWKVTVFLALDSLVSST